MNFRETIGYAIEAAATGAVGSAKSLMAYVKQLVTGLIAIQTDIGDPSTRSNLQSIEAMLGNPDGAGKSLYLNLGDFVGQTNLQSLLAALGVPDVAGKSLYVCLVTDRLDHATYGLAAIEGEVAAIQADLGDPSTRSNLQSIEAMLGNPDAAGKSLYLNLGDFVGQTNLQSLLAALGVPDVAGKSLYVCLVTDRLDDATFGLAAIEGEVAAIQTDIGDPSTRTNLKSIEAMLGNPDTAGATIYAALAGTIDAVNRAAGKAQMKAATVDLHQAAADYDLFTGTTQDVVLESLCFRVPNIDVSDDAGGITEISIQTDDATPQEIVSAADGAVANLTAEAQINWAGAILIKTGTKIQLTLGGGTADADPTTCDVVATYRAVVSGGYLA